MYFVKLNWHIPYISFFHSVLCELWCKFFLVFWRFFFVQLCPFFGRTISLCDHFYFSFFYFDGFLAIPPPSLLFATNKTFWTFFSRSKKSQFSWKQRPHKNVALSWLSQSYCMMWEWYLNTMLLKNRFSKVFEIKVSIYTFFEKMGLLCIRLDGSLFLLP